uniref:Uncharacterized protein n=1 Tax=Vespula pensylvanica TaxID=30213 RepID=A0A834N8Z6_VESPE|nr:hypothetical protein H0235_015972 [Vespula pensylvanica]
MMPGRSRRIDLPESENAMEVPREQGKFQKWRMSRLPGLFAYHLFSSKILKDKCGTMKAKLTASIREEVE